MTIQRAETLEMPLVTIGEKVITRFRKWISQAVVVRASYTSESRSWKYFIETDSDIDEVFAKDIICIYRNEEWVKVCDIQIM